MTDLRECPTADARVAALLDARRRVELLHAPDIFAAFRTVAP